MDTAMIFAILGIAETKEEEQIRQAYRTKLTENNPEDDPEGFRRLRDAYEQALAYARETEAEEETEEEEDTTPVGQWMGKVKEVYFSLSKRLDTENWKRLFRDEICMDLEYAEEVKWRFFRFLAEHYHLNSENYRVLDEFFGIQEGEAEFKEHLPIAFVDYMLRKIQDIERADDFPYQWIQGADTADYDGFQERLYELEELLSEEKEKEAEQVVTVMEQFAIEHPYYQLARARLSAMKGEKEAALLAEELLKDYPESAKIQALSAEVLWNCDKKEKAAEVFQVFGEKFGIYYIAEKYLAEYQKEQGNLGDAIDHCLQALRRAEDEGLNKMLQELDEAYIAECKEKQTGEALTIKEAARICGAYIRTQHYQEGIQFLLENPEYMEKEKNFYSYLSTLYYRSRQYKESIQASRRWREAILACEDVQESEGEKLHLAVSYSQEALSISMLVKNALEEGRKEEYTYQEAKDAYKKALEYAPDNTDIKQDLLDLFIDAHSYKEAISLADELLSWNKEWYPALVQKQKACYELGQAQEVVDLFYQAKEVYAGYAQIYELTVRVFCDYRQFQDAERILDQAKEAQVEGFGLDLAALRCERMQCRNDVGFYEGVKKGEALLKKFEEGKAKKIEFAELYFELAILEDCQYYKEFIHEGKAEEYIKKAIELSEQVSLEETIPYYYTYGHILQGEEKYREAIEAYQTYAKKSELTEMTAMNLGHCYDELGEWEEAIRYYKEALSLNPEQKEANGKIAAIYKKEGDKKNSVPLIRKALPYETRQIEMNPTSSYHYRVRGIIYKMLGDLEKALEDTNKAVQLDKRNPYGLNLKGRILYYMGKYQQALFFYKKSIDNLKDPKENGWAMYTNAAESCQKMGDFAQAEKWYRRGMALFEGSDLSWCYWELAKLYKGQKRYQDALALLKEAYEKGYMNEEKYLVRYFGVKKMLCHTKEQAQVLEQEALEAAKRIDTIEIWEEVSDIQYYYLFDIERALETKKMVMDRLEKKNDWMEQRGKLLERMQIYWELGDQKEVERLGNIYWKTIEENYDIDTEEYPAIEQYKNDPNRAYENCYNLIQYWIFTGQLELAKEGLEYAKGVGKCRDCRECVCQVLEEVEATYWEAIGEIEKAYQRYCEIYEQEPTERAYYKKVVLGEMVKKRETEKSNS
ncbi:MAG: tetratricopeptide repeat protein [Lachnospiraceae bacterium]|nr:tetratricopeptide repeat protein [Lachnospiraceae bacterium]